MFGRQHFWQELSANGNLHPHIKGELTEGGTSVPGVLVSAAGLGDAVIGAHFVVALDGNDGGGVPLSTIATLVPSAFVFLLFLMMPPAALAGVLVGGLGAPAPVGLPPPLL